MPFLVFVVAILLLPLSTQAAESPTITVQKTNGQPTSFIPFSAENATIGSITAGDLGRDGTAEILVGSGPGMSPTVSVFRQDGSSIGQFDAYDTAFKGGVNVAACDLDGDSESEIITGARFGGGPHIRIFNNLGQVKYPGFFAYAEDFRGGVYVACGDIDNDGRGDIVTGAGLSGGPHLKVFTPDGTLRYEIFNGSAAQNTGSYVSMHEGVVHAAPIGIGEDVVTSFTVNDGVLEAVGTESVSDRALYFSQASVSSSVNISAEVEPALFSSTDSKYISVDISEQRLTAYEYGIPINSFLVSTGLYGYDTPYGNFSVIAKVPIVDYIGADYSYPDTPWNLRFKPHYYIHTAYWHNDFGRRRSHGCVNMRESEAKWMYDWANVNTPVEIVP